MRDMGLERGCEIMAFHKYARIAKEVREKSARSPREVCEIVRYVFENYVSNV